MVYRLDAFTDIGLDEALLALLIEQHERSVRPRLARLWSYYRNPLEAPGQPRGNSTRPRLAQEAGLPPRLTGSGRDPALDDRGWARREIVIENDIGWRIQSMVDFMFGKPVAIVSTARDDNLRRTIERVLDAVWEASGGIALLQDAALLGHVYGHIDLLLKINEDAGARGPRKLPAPGPAPLSGNSGPGLDAIVAAATRLARIEIIEPTRGIPLLSTADYRTIDAYIIHFERELNSVRSRPAQSKAAWRFLGGPASGPARRRSCLTQIISARARQVYEDGRLIEESANRWMPGELPVVHIQNISQPFRFDGQSDVEPLIPLQDELNTRLSDRASRVTLQSFKMYLAKGIDGFETLPVGPGQVIATDNPDAAIEAFGGDAASPSEEAHIQEIREALDKTSGVPPLASGVVRAKIGNLSSANALRITLMGVLSKTARKRVSYGRGITQMSRLILTALDSAGILRTDPSDRGVRLVWPDPLPEDLREQAAAARAKQELGVPAERVLAELGYAPADPGIT